MNALIRMVQLSFLPSSSDLGLLVLRLWLGASMLALHGWGKLVNFSSLSASFPDPLGIGSLWSLVLALCGEVLCQALIIVGFATRLAALGSAVTMGVAWYVVHGAALQGKDSGELAFIYLAGYVVLFLAGAGRFSLDGRGPGSTSHIRPVSSRK